MRGDQLARQWRVIRAIEASPGGLTVAEIAKREETGIRTIYRDLESLQAAGFPLYTERVDRVNRWAFIDTFKFKIPPLQSRKDAKITKGNIQAFNAFIMRPLAFVAPWRESFSRKAAEAANINILKSLRLGSVFFVPVLCQY
jgi:hypothetical protein